jgi:hypothetical protein
MGQPELRDFLSAHLFREEVQLRFTRDTRRTGIGIGSPTLPIAAEAPRQIVHKVFASVRPASVGAALQRSAGLNIVDA